jgi:hypothetical protein
MYMTLSERKTTINLKRSYKRQFLLVVAWVSAGYTATATQLFCFARNVACVVLAFSSLSSSVLAENSAQQVANVSTAITPAAKAEADLQKQELQEVISSWASAWQSQLEDVYFLHYHPDYRPEGYANVSAWRKVKGALIRKPQEISINLHDFAVVGTEAGIARVQFWLDFAKPGYSDKTKKEIVLKQEGQLWLIAKETNLQVIGPESSLTTNKGQDVVSKAKTGNSVASSKKGSSKAKVASSAKSKIEGKSKSKGTTSASKTSNKTKAVAASKDGAKSANKVKASTAKKAKTTASTDGKARKTGAKKSARVKGSSSNAVSAAQGGTRSVGRSDEQKRQVAASQPVTKALDPTKRVD